MSEVSLCVLHIEDEAWNFDELIGLLREIILDDLTPKDATSMKLKFPTGAPVYPRTYELHWVNRGVNHQIRYCIIEDTNQLPDDEFLKEVEAFVFDVMRTGADGRPISSWRRYAQALSAYIEDLSEQVRLYTAYDLSDDDDEDFDAIGDDLRNTSPPPRIRKGDSAILQFVMDRLPRRPDA